MYTTRKIYTTKLNLPLQQTVISLYRCNNITCLVLDWNDLRKCEVIHCMKRSKHDRPLDRCVSSSGTQSHFVILSLLRVCVMRVSVLFHFNHTTAIKFRWLLPTADFTFTAVGSGKFHDLRWTKIVENLGFHLKRNFVVHAGHPKNSEVRVLKKWLGSSKRNTRKTWE